MRPNTLRWFEYALIASQLVRIVAVALHLDVIARVTGLSAQTILIGPFANAIVLIGLGLAVSRARVGFARWFLIVLMALDVAGLAGIPSIAVMIGVPFAALSVIAVLLLVAAGVLMFRPSSTAWLKRDRVDASDVVEQNRDGAGIESQKSWVHTIVVQWSKRRNEGD